MKNGETTSSPSVKGKILNVLIVTAIVITGMFVSAFGEPSDYDPFNQTISHLSFTYKFTDKCTTEIYKEGKLEGTLGWALSGTANGENYHKLGSNFDCVWWSSTEIIDDGYENLTVTKITGFNQNTKLNATQEWIFTNNSDPKIDNILTNDLVDISNFKFWFINTIPKDTIIRYNGNEYMVGTDEDYKGTNLDNVLPMVEVENAYDFRYGDLIKEGFNITNVVVTDGSYLNLPDDTYIMAVGVSKGDRNFNKGMTISLDPTITDYKFPTAFNDPESDWVLPSRLNASDDSRSSTTVLNALTDTDTYNFGVSSSLSDIHGVQIRAEGQSACSGGCGIKPSATLSIRLSWDGGNNYTAWKSAAAFGIVSEITRTYGSLIDDWGHTWVVNETVNEFNSSNFRIQINASIFNNGGNFEEYSGGGIDGLSARVNFTGMPYNLTWRYPTASQNGIFGATLRANATSDVLLDTVDGCYFVLQRYNSTDELQAPENTTNFIFDAIGGRKECSRVFTTDEILNATDHIPGQSKYRIQMSGNPTGSQVGTSPTEFRNVTKSNTASTASFDIPTDGQIFNTGNKSILLNFTTNDTENDFIKRVLFITNDSTRLSEGRFVFDVDGLVWMEGGTFEYNFTFSPLLSNADYSSYELFYHMNNESSLGENNTLLVDYAGNHNASMVNITPIEDGRFAGGINFSSEHGSGNAYILLGTGSNFSTLPDGSGFTIGLWVKPQASPGNRLIARYDNADHRFFMISGFTSNAVRFNIGGDGTVGQDCNADTGTNVLTDNEWNHILVVWDNRSVTSKIYVNGKLEDTTDCSPDFSSVDLTSWAEDETTYIGAFEASGSPSGFMDTIVDYVFINDSNMTATQVQNLFTLQADTYFWNLSVTDTNLTTMNESTYNFSIEDVAVDSCTYTSGIWNILCSDDCNIGTPVDVGGDDVSITGEGSFTYSAIIKNIGKLILGSTYQGDSCNFVRLSGGDFNFG